MFLSHKPPVMVGLISILKSCYHAILYGCVSEGLGTTEFTIWLAEIDTESGLDFPIYTGDVLWWKSCLLKEKNMDYFLLTTFIYGNAKKSDEKKSKEDKQALPEVQLIAIHKQNAS